MDGKGACRIAGLELVSSPFDLASGIDVAVVPGQHPLVADKGLRPLAAFELAPGELAVLRRGDSTVSER